MKPRTPQENAIGCFTIGLVAFGLVASAVAMVLALRLVVVP